MPPKKKMKKSSKESAAVAQTTVLDPAHFRFLDLPAEMRNMIYEFAIINHDAKDKRQLRLRPPPLSVRSIHLGQWKIKIHGHHFWRPAYPALSQVNRQLRNEFMSIYHVRHGLKILPEHIPAYIDEFYGSPIPGPPHKASIMVLPSKRSSGGTGIDITESIVMINRLPTLRCRLEAAHRRVCEKELDGVLFGAGNTHLLPLIGNEIERISLNLKSSDIPALYLRLTHGTVFDWRYEAKGRDSTNKGLIAFLERAGLGRLHWVIVCVDYMGENGVLRPSGSRDRA